MIRGHDPIGQGLDSFMLDLRSAQVWGYHVVGPKG